MRPFLASPFLASLLALLLAACGSDPAPTGPTVLAASSTQEAMTEAAQAWSAQGHPAPVLSFAASGALARQIAVGAPADLFVSADEKWMDWLSQQVGLKPDSRADVAGNTLALVAPAGSNAAFPAKGEWAAAIGKRRLALADPAAVPAGRYGRAALTALGAWPEVQDRIAQTADVRGALALVARGDAPLGVVYASDAQAEDGVRIVGVFPESSHQPIRYPLAIPARSRHPDATGFRAFLLSDAGQAIFARHGFAPAASPAQP